MHIAYLFYIRPASPGAVYLIDNLPRYMKKHRIFNSDTKEKFCFNYEKIVFADSNVANGFPTGKMIK